MQIENAAEVELQADMGADPSAPDPTAIATPRKGQQYEILTGVFNREHFRPADHAETGNTWVMGSLEDGTTVSGNADVGDLIPGITYRFYGRWEAPKRLKPGQRQYGNGKRFAFVNFTKAEPHSRFGLVHYLQKFAPGVGPSIATRLWDAYGSDACKVLRLDPVRVAREIKGLTLEQSRKASAALGALAKTEDTKIELHNLLANRGFPGKAIEEAIKKWGALAPLKIARDPFWMLIAEIPGAGFLRCDRLYNDLGLNPNRTRRRMLCLWDWMQKSMDGHTWFAAKDAAKQLDKKLSIPEEQIARAIRRGVKTGWIATRVDSAGNQWIANAMAARHEAQIAADIARLVRGHVELELMSGAACKADETAVKGIHLTS